MNDPTPGASGDDARPPPAWLDDPAASIALDRVRASLEHRAATERAEGRSGPAPPPTSVSGGRKPRPRFDQPTLFDLPGDRQR